MPPAPASASRACFFAARYAAPVVTCARAGPTAGDRATAPDPHAPFAPPGHAPNRRGRDCWRFRPISASARTSLSKIVKSFIGTTARARSQDSTTASCATAQRESQLRSRRPRWIEASPKRGSGASATTTHSPRPAIEQPAVRPGPADPTEPVPRRVGGLPARHSRRRSLLRPCKFGRRRLTGSRSAFVVVTRQTARPRRSLGSRRRR